MIRSEEGRSWTVYTISWLHRIEDTALTIVLVLTLGLAIGQIILRNLLGTSIVWADILVRILVLWLGMIGAMIAAREDKHISIDVISRYVSDSRLLAAKGIVSLITGCVCAIAGYYSLGFVMGEYQSGEIAFARVPAWLCEAILPTAFTVMALRFWRICGLCILQLRKAKRT